MKLNRLLLPGVMLLAHSPAHSLLQVGPVPDIELNAWAGLTSDLEGVASFCIISSNPNNPNRARRYDVAGYSITPGSTAGEFPVRNQTTGNDINITYTFIHPEGTYPLTDYTTTGYVTPNVRGAINCTEALSAVQINLTLPQAELAVAEAGVYLGTLGFDVLQSGNGGQYSSVLQFQATVPELAQISRLDNLDMPAGTLQDSEDFCVFRNGAGGFRISVTGENDTATEFNLIDTETVPYTVSFVQGAIVEPVAPGEILYSSVSGFTGGTTRDCGGADNIAIQLDISEESLTKPAGTYEDTLTITVAPD